VRLETARGPVYVWRPEGYEPSTAGIVVYVHGFFTSLDQTWTDDHLAAQFQASGRNAVFIAPEAPQSAHDGVSWESLAALLGAVDEAAPFPLPHGPVILVGHSGGFRTILDWLNEPRVQCVILLDGLYGGQTRFRAWLRTSPRGQPHRMVLVAYDTWRRSNRFARRTPGAVRRASIPKNSSNFTPRETRARLLFLRSQYGHMEIVNNGKVIPLLLEITALKPLADARESRPQPRPSAAKRISCLLIGSSSAPNRLALSRRPSP
jgi:pimeloyl-ACP methyl ester carboxylesterase